MSTAYMANNMPLQEEIKDGHIYAISFKNSDSSSKNDLSIATGALQSKDVLSVLKGIPSDKLTVSLVVRDNFADSFGKQVSYTDFRKLLNIKDEAKQAKMPDTSAENPATHLENPTTHVENPGIHAEKTPDSSDHISDIIGELRIHELTDYTSLEF